MSIYPRPCDTCEAKDVCDTQGSRYLNCNRWLTWFRWWWKQFNLYAQKHGIEPTTPKEQEEETND